MNVILSVAKDLIRRDASPSAQLSMTVVVLLTFTTAAFGADCTAISTLSCGTTAASLSNADCTASDSSQYRLWQFSGTAGDSVTIEMHSTAFDAYLMLLDPNGAPLAENDDSASGVTDSKITLTL